jgi:hypothetical protein
MTPTSIPSYHRYPSCSLQITRCFHSPTTCGRTNLHIVIRHSGELEIGANYNVTVPQPLLTIYLHFSQAIPTVWAASTPRVLPCVAWDLASIESQRYSRPSIRHPNVVLPGGVAETLTALAASRHTTSSSIYTTTLP